jgi:hypothetical protein
MGHYGEPPLEMEVAVNSEKTENLTCIMDYNPSTRVWNKQFA